MGCIGRLALEDAVRIESRMSGLHEGQCPVDLGLFILELVLTQGDVKPAQVKECLAFNTISIKVIWGYWFKPHACTWGVWSAGVTGSWGSNATGIFWGVRESPMPGMCCNSWRMWSRVFCWTLACFWAWRSPDLSLEMRSSASVGIWVGFSSMMAGCNVKEEGELGGVYRGGVEHSESLVLIPYLTMVSSCTQLPVLRDESILL